MCTVMMARAPARSGNRPVERGEGRLVARHGHLASAGHAQDARRPVEGAEHERDAAVLAEVGDGLGAAAGEVEVGDGVLVEHPEAVVALRRQVDVTVVADGAVATKKMGCASTHAMRLASSASSITAHVGHRGLVHRRPRRRPGGRGSWSG